MDEPMGVPTLTREESLELIRERKKILAMIADAYRRAATNTSLIYRAQQMQKCDAWLAELTAINARDPLAFNLDEDSIK